MAWGDSFFFYDPDDSPDDRRMPFTTIVTKDYDGFDEASDLNRPGVFRLNISVGRTALEELIGYPAPEDAAQAETGRFDYTAFDQLFPHPAYAPQAWVSIINPGENTCDLARSLITGATLRRPSATAAAIRNQPLSSRLKLSLIAGREPNTSKNTASRASRCAW